MKIELSRRQLEAVATALECEIPTRREANRGFDGQPIDTEPDAIDAVVPAMEEALYTVRKKLDR